VPIKTNHKFTFSDLDSMNREILRELARDNQITRLACYRLSGQNATLILDTCEDPSISWPAIISSTNYYCTLKNRPHLTFGWQATPNNEIKKYSALRGTKSYLPPQEPWATKVLFIVEKKGRSSVEISSLDGFLEALARKFHFWLASDELRHFIDDTTIQGQNRAFGSQVSHIVNHEIRNPVMNLMSLAQTHLILWKDSGAEVEQFASEVEAYTQRIWDVIQKLELLEANGKEDFRPAEVAKDVDLKALISLECAIWSSSPPSYQKQDKIAANRLQVSMADGSLIISGSPSLIKMAVREVLQNAFMYSAGTPITLSLYHAGENIILDISDEGLPIPPGQEELMFMRYYQGQNSPINKSSLTRGLGLGLYLARFICAIHNAQLIFVRGVGKKGVFRFIWPENKPASKAS
jgi:K+-sensing histidine kinase KdpD